MDSQDIQVPSDASPVPQVDTSQNPQQAIVPPWKEVIASPEYQQLNVDKKQYILDHWHAAALSQNAGVLGKDDIMDLNNFVKNQSQLISNSDVSIPEGSAEEVMQGGTLGLGKYGAAALETAFPEKKGYKLPFQGQSYSDNLKDIEQRQGSFENQHPYISTGANVAGNMLLPVGEATAALGAASKGVPVGGRVAGYLGEHPNQANALIGAGIGGVQESTNEDDLSGFIPGAAKGMAAGLIAAPLIRGGVNALKGTVNLGKRVLGIQENPESIIGKFLNSENLAAARTSLENNEEGFLADEPKLQQFTRTVLKTSPEAQDTIESNLIDRASSSRDRAAQAAEDFKTPYFQNLQDSISEIKQNSDESWNKLFENKTPLLTPDIAELMHNPEIQSAIKSTDASFRSSGNQELKGLGHKALEALKAKGSEVPELGEEFESLAPQAKQALQDRLMADQPSINTNDFDGFPIEYGHQVKRQLDAKARQAYLSGDESTGNIYNGFARQWRGALDEATNGTYSAAREASQPLQQIKAIQGGTQFIDNKSITKPSLASRMMLPNVRPEAVDQELNGLTNLQKIQLKIDLANELQNDIGNRTQNIGAANPFSGNEEKKIRMIINAPDEVVPNEYENFMQAMQNEKRMAQTKTAVSGNSRTDINTASSGQLPVNAFKTFIGGPKRWTSDAIDYLSAKSNGLNQKNAQDLANILVSHERSLQALDNIDEARAQKLLPAIMQKTIENFYDRALIQALPAQAANVGE